MYEKENLHPKYLTTETNFRFFELELSRAVHVLTKLTKDERQSATIIVNALVPYPYPNKDTLVETMLSYNFLNPTTSENVQYLRYKNLGVHKIRKIAQISPNSLYKGATHDIVPDFQPLFEYWHEIPFTISTWDHLKHTLNLFHEDLIHMIEPKGNYTHSYLFGEKAPTPTQPTVQPVSVPEAPKPSRLIKLFNFTLEQYKRNPYEALETTEEDMHMFQSGIDTGTPIALVTHYEEE